MQFVHNAVCGVWCVLMEETKLLLKLTQFMHGSGPGPGYCNDTTSLCACNLWLDSDTFQGEKIIAGAAGVRLIVVTLVYYFTRYCQ